MGICPLGHSRLSGILLNPSLAKRGKGRFYREWIYSKSPSNPPLLKGDDTKKDSL